MFEQVRKAVADFNSNAISKDGLKSKIVEATPQMAAVLEANRAGNGLKEDGTPRTVSNFDLNKLAQSLGFTSNTPAMELLSVGFGVTENSTYSSFSSIPGIGTEQAHWLLKESLLVTLNPDLEVQLKLTNKLVSRPTQFVTGTLITAEIDANMKPSIVKAGDSLSLGTMSFKKRENRPFVIGKKFQVHRDLMRELTIDAFASAMPFYTRDVNISKINSSVAVVLSGDGAAANNGALNIGVNNPSSGFSITYKDVIRAFMCTDADVLVANTNTLTEFNELPEVKGGNFNNVLLNLDSNRVPRQLKTVRNELLPDNVIGFIDSNTALLEFSHRGREVAYSFDNNNDMHEYFIREGVGYKVTDKLAYVILNGTMPYAGIPTPFLNRYTPDYTFNYNPF